MNGDTQTDDGTTPVSRFGPKDRYVGAVSGGTQTAAPPAPVSRFGPKDRYVGPAAGGAPTQTAAPLPRPPAPRAPSSEFEQQHPYVADIGRGKGAAV